MRRRHLLALFAAAPIARAWAVDTSKAQAELPKEKLVIVSRDGARRVFNVEMALTSDQQTVGEMFRPTVPEGRRHAVRLGHSARVPDVDA